LNEAFKEGTVKMVPSYFMKHPASLFLKKAICFLGFLIKLYMFNQKGKTIRCFSLL